MNQGSAYGIGVDLVYVPEFTAALRDPATAFFRTCFAPAEYEYCWNAPSGQRAQRFAARYAAKEACLKALDGPRLHQGRAIEFRYAEAEVHKDDYGRPFFLFRGELAEYLRSLSLRSQVSLSHVGEYAIAQVCLERNP